MMFTPHQSLRTMDFLYLGHISKFYCRVDTLGVCRRAVIARNLLVNNTDFFDVNDRSLGLYCLLLGLLIISGRWTRPSSRKIQLL